MRKRYFAVAAGCLMVLLVVAQAFACTTIIVGKKVSPTGYVIVGHNEDDGGRLTVRHGFVPAREFKEGAVLPAEEGRAAIPQVPKTFAFYWSQVKGAEGGMSNADAMLNVNGVFVASNSCARSREDMENIERLTEGGIEYNLRRVIAERATSARNGVEIAVAMLKQYGYAPSGRTYTIADKDEGWMVQVVSGKQFLAIRVPDDEVTFMPNHYTVRAADLKSDKEIITSDELVEYAKKKGWYDPEKDGDFDFAKAYQADGSWQQSYNILRQAGGLAILLRNPWQGKELPFSVRPDTPVTVSQVKEALRSHYEGTCNDPVYARAQFPGGAPHDTTIRRICTGSTVESTVVTFSKYPELTAVWTAFGHPCVLPYIPMHPLSGKLPKEISSMVDPAIALEDHLKPDVDYAVWRGDGWQEMRDFASAFELVYQENYDAQNRRLWNMEYFWEKGEQELVADVIALMDEKKIDEAKARLAEWDQKEMTGTLLNIADMYKTLRIVDTIADPMNLPLDGENSTITVSFTLEDGDRPNIKTQLVGLGFTNARTTWQPAIDGSLKKLDNGIWSADFKIGNMAKDAVKGMMEYWLGGRDAAGKSFAGRFFITYQ